MLVFPRPFGPMMKLKPGSNSTARDSKQRKFRSCRSRNITRPSQTNELQTARHLWGALLWRKKTAIDWGHICRGYADRGGNEIVVSENPVCPVHPNPARARQINLRPGVKRPFGALHLGLCFAQISAR